MRERGKKGRKRGVRERGNRGKKRENSKCKWGKGGNEKREVGEREAKGR